MTRPSFVEKVLHLYPRAWRDRYGAEIEDLVDEVTAHGEFSSTRVTLGLIVSALWQRIRAIRPSRRTLSLTGSTLALAAILLVVVTHGPRPAHPPRPSIGETKGTIPASTSGTIDSRKVPDFISVTAEGKTVGYAPRDYLVPPPGEPGQNSPVGGVLPIFGADLKTLVGHMYPGIGWVPLDGSPSAGPCPQVTAIGNGTTSTLPCPSTKVVVPNVVGMPTPEGVGALQAAGLGILVQNGNSGTVPSGHVARTTPAAGSNAFGREVVTVINSVGPGSS